MKRSFEIRVILSVTILLIILTLGNAQTIVMQSTPSGLLSGQQSVSVNQEINLPKVSIEKTSFVVRDIFRLKFGHYREAIALIDEAMKSNMMPSVNFRVLTDFTGDAYRLIMEMGFNSLADYEKSLSSELNVMAFRDWYEKFKPHVESSSREILKWVR